MKNILLPTCLVFCFIISNAQDCNFKKKIKLKYDNYKDLLHAVTLKPDTNYYIVEGKSKTINRYGIVDKNANEIVPPIYEDYFYIGDGRKVVGRNAEKEINDVWDLVTKTKITLPFKKADFHVSEDMIAFEGDGGLWGFCNTKGEIVLKPAYKSVSTEFVNGVVIVTNSEEKYGVINKKGEQVIDYKFDYLSPCGKNLYIVCLGKDLEKYGLIDLKGNTILPMEYKLIAERDGMVEVQNVDLISAYYSLDGKKLTEFVYEPNFVSLNKHGFMVVDKNDKPLILDNKATEYLANKYTYISDNSYNSGTLPKNLFYFATKPMENGRPEIIGLMNLEGKVIFPEQYTSIEILPNRENIFALTKTVNNKVVCTIQTLEGKTISTTGFTIPLATVGNYAFGKNDKGVGAIDLVTGKIVIPFVYEDIEEVNECKIALTKAGKTIYFDQKLNKIQ